MLLARRSCDKSSSLSYDSKFEFYREDTNEVLKSHSGDASLLAQACAPVRQYHPEPCIRSRG